MALAKSWHPSWCTFASLTSFVLRLVNAYGAKVIAQVFLCSANLEPHICTSEASTCRIGHTHQRLSWGDNKILIFVFFETLICILYFSTLYICTSYGRRSKGNKHYGWSWGDNNITLWKILASILLAPTGALIVMMCWYISNPLFEILRIYSFL